MTVSLRFYSDSGLTTPLTRIDATQSTDGNAGAVDRAVYLGSTIASVKFQSQSSPGTGQISVSISDSQTGLQIPASTIRLALTANGLNSATPGAAIDVGTEISSGSANAKTLYVRFDAAAIAAGIYDNLSLTTNSVIEIAA